MVLFVLGFHGGSEGKKIHLTRYRRPGLEDPLEKEIATHSIILGRRLPWTEQCYNPTGGKKFKQTEQSRREWIPGSGRAKRALFWTVKLFAGLGRQVPQRLALRGTPKERNNPEISAHYYQVMS